MVAQNGTGGYGGGTVQEMRQYVLVDPATLDEEPPPEKMSSGVPSVIRAFVVINEPKITVYPNFLTESEAASLISLGGDSWAATAGASAKTSSPSEEWSSARPECARILRNSQTKVVTAIEHRVAKIAGLPIAQLERVILCRFQPGQCLEDIQESRFRLKTVIVFLNTMPDEEAEIDFPELLVRFRPSLGSAFAFGNTNVYEQEDTRVKYSFTAPQTQSFFVLRCYFAESPVRAVPAIQGQPDPKPFITIDPKYVLDHYGKGRYKDETGKEVVKMFQVHKNPAIYIVPCFIEDDEIQHLIGLAERAWVPSTVGRGVYKTGDVNEDLKNTKSNNRTSYSCMLRSSETAQVTHVEYRLAALAKMDIQYLERLNMVRYYPGQYFNEHHDGNFRPKTVFIYLNDLEDEEGGETMFTNLGVQIKPRKGCAVMWSNLDEDGKQDDRMIHRGVAPLSGVKYGVNCFFNDKPIREMEAAVQQVDANHGKDR
eukprot:gnl/MRDRNA2_/MRDRNA2_91092_c0_seq1.p1 gnl/MRDRNA2_/MRDRNA2_91092_c0~~gnl/MRDRNA2_/MRDRNA2_91092_c0_seq1.p1  ORF type:complete len:483 (-),score=85.60 gnl/MRDRNA2_/MRDRNA2_91092_c0_seq1:41-1489(-)